MPASRTQAIELKITEYIADKPLHYCSTDTDGGNTEHVFRERDAVIVFGQPSPGNKCLLIDYSKDPPKFYEREYNMVISCLYQVTETVEKFNFVEMGYTIEGYKVFSIYPGAKTHCNAIDRFWVCPELLQPCPQATNSIGAAAATGQNVDNGISVVRLTLQRRSSCQQQQHLVLSNSSVPFNQPFNGEQPPQQFPPLPPQLAHSNNNTSFFPTTGTGFLPSNNNNSASNGHSNLSVDSAPQQQQQPSYYPNNSNNIFLYDLYDSFTGYPQQQQQQWQQQQQSQLWQEDGYEDEDEEEKTKYGN